MRVIGGDDRDRENWEHYLRWAAGGARADRQREHILRMTCQIMPPGWVDTFPPVIRRGEGGESVFRMTSAALAEMTDAARERGDAMVTLGGFTLPAAVWTADALACIYAWKEDA